MTRFEYTVQYLNGHTTWVNGTTLRNIEEEDKIYIYNEDDLAAIIYLPNIIGIFVRKLES